MDRINNHERVNDILLGPLERPALRWLAAHMPAWITPDICTAIGVLGALCTAVSDILSVTNKNFLLLASLGFVINWFGDSLDGTLARYRHIERPIYGFFVDHMLDAIAVMMMFVGMGMTFYVRLDVACLTLSAYLLLTLLVFVRTFLVGEFKISFGKIGPTEGRVLAILLHLWMYFGGAQTFVLELGPYGERIFSHYDVLVACVCVLLLLLFLITAMTESIKLSKVDDKPGA